MRHLPLLLWLIVISDLEYSNNPFCGQNQTAAAYYSNPLARRKGTRRVWGMAAMKYLLMTAAFLFSLTPVSGSIPSEPNFGVDFVGSGSNAQSGFLPFDISGTGEQTKTMTGVSTGIASNGSLEITLVGGPNSTTNTLSCLTRTRSAPTNGGYLTYATLYDSWIGYNPSGSDSMWTTLSGLVPNKAYTIDWWGYDNSAGGTLTFTDFTTGSAGSSGSVTWTANYAFANDPDANYRFMTPLSVVSDSNGNLVIQNTSSANGYISNGFLVYPAFITSNFTTGCVTDATIANQTITSDKFEFPFICATDPPYNAAGDGVTDDTAAIQSALNAMANNGGGIVYLPAATYNIATNLVIPENVSLCGVWTTPAQQMKMGTTLLASATGTTPFIAMDSCSALDGVCIYYPNQTATNPPIAYPYSIQGNRDVTIQNVMLYNSYNGIDFFTNPSDRHLVRGLYGQPLNNGITVDQCEDIGRLKDIYFYPCWSNSSAISTYMLNNAIAISTERSDWEIMSDITTSGYHIGLNFVSSTYGATNGQIKNLTCNNADMGIYLATTQEYGVFITNFSVQISNEASTAVGISHHAGATANLTVTGAAFSGPANYDVYWNSAGTISIANSNFNQWNSTNSAVLVYVGQIILTGDSFASGTGNAVTATSGCTRALLTGNDSGGNSLILSNSNNYSGGNL